MWNAGLDEAQAGIKIAGRNINNLRYAVLMAESKKELKSLLMKVKESEKADLKLSIQKPKKTERASCEGERGEWKSWLKTQHS